MTDDSLACAFDDAGTDEPSVRAVLVVLHPSDVAAEVLVFAHGVALESVPHLVPQVVEDVLYFTVPDAFRPVAMAIVPFLRSLLDPQSEHQWLDVFDGMVDVEDLDREGEVAFVNRMQPLASVCDVEDCFRQRGEPPVELISEIFAEFLAPVCRRDVGRRVEVAVRFVVACPRGDEYGPRLDLARLRPAVLPLDALQAFLSHRHPGPVGHDADDLRLVVRLASFARTLVLDEGRGAVVVESDDFAHGVGGHLECVVAREFRGRVLVGVVNAVAHHFVRGSWSVSPDQPQPVVEGVVSAATVLVPVVGARDLRELSEERDDLLAVVSGVALIWLGLVVLRGGGTSGEELGHEFAAETVHVVEERLLELRRAGDAVAFDRVRGGVNDGVDLRGASQDEVCEFFF